MKINKKLLQVIAALWILAFHLWMPVFDTKFSSYMIHIGYIGVDIFFFTSAFSLSDKEIGYWSFIKNRFFQVYLKFILFVVVAAIIKQWSLQKILSIISGTELLVKGGGAFLWFIPAIMLFYVSYPLFLKIPWKYKSILVLLLWFITSLVSEKIFGYNKIFIFTNRIPVILLGYELKHYKLPNWLNILCIPIGLSLLYFFGNTRKLNEPFYNFYFVFGIFIVVGLSFLSGYIRECKVLSVLAASTFEVYAIQMLFGSKLVNAIYSLINNKLLTNIISTIAIWTVSYILCRFFCYFVILKKNMV